MNQELVLGKTGKTDKTLTRLRKKEKKIQVNIVKNERSDD